MDSRSRRTAHRKGPVTPLSEDRLPVLRSNSQYSLVACPLLSAPPSAADGSATGLAGTMRSRAWGPGRQDTVVAQEMKSGRGNPSRQLLQQIQRREHEMAVPSDHGVVSMQVQQARLPLSRFRCHRWRAASRGCGRSGRGSARRAPGGRPGWRSRPDRRSGRRARAGRPGSGRTSIPRA